MPLGGVLLEEPLCFNPGRARKGAWKHRDWLIQREQEWIQVNDRDANAGNYNRFHSLQLDFKIRKGSRIYEGDNRQSKHEEKNNNTEILNKPGVYWQEVSSGDHTEI